MPIRVSEQPAVPGTRDLRALSGSAGVVGACCDLLARALGLYTLPDGGRDGA